MFTENNVLHVEIAKNLARTANVQITDPSNATTYIKDGETVLTAIDGTILTTATVMPPEFVVVQGRGAGKPLLQSPVIKRGKLLNYKISTEADGVEQVSYIGYNGTSGAINVINDNVYLARINRQDLQKTFGNKQMLKFGVYKSDASATKAEIVHGLVDSFIANFKREAEPVIAFGVTNAGARTIIPTGAGTLAFVKGSNKVTFSTDIADATGAVAISVGDYLTVASATTNVVYRVTAIDTVTDVATIDRAFQETSVTVANATAKVIYAATATAANFGIKLSGLPARFVVGSFKYHKVRFQISLSDFGTTDLTYTTAAYEGSGTYEQVSELEWFAQGNEGKIERIGVPPPTSRADVQSARTYDLLSIEYFDDQMDATIQGNRPSRKQFLLALEANNGAQGTSITGAASAVVDALDDFIVTDWAFGTAQVGNLT